MGFKKNLNERPGPLLSLALTAPAKLFGLVASGRGLLYDSSGLEIVDTGVPVMSIGNVTAGGTGKTPITSFLVGDLAKRGIECAIVSRGYGALEKGPAIVPAGGSAVKFGDEPIWLATQHPSVPVVIGAKRPEAVQFLRTQQLGEAAAAWQASKRRIVVADDAFQHRRLKRNLDIVVLDATEPRWHYQPLPLGRMREDFDALKRAQFVFISKTNLASSREDIDWLRAHAASKRIVEFGVSIKGFVSLDRNKPTAAIENVAAKNVVLVSGLARPSTFEMMVRRDRQVAKHFVFKDHHSYSQADLETIEREASDLKAEAIFVTEKDAVKLRDWHPAVPVYVSRLTAQPLTSMGEFHEAVDRIF